ncbi:MAG: methylisocitrate lyase [Planctomycetaceae bacterium]
MSSSGARLRAALVETKPLIIVGVFNALTARMAARAGFRAVYQSGAALSASLAAVPDVGLVTQTEFAEQGRYLAGAVTVPVLSDADAGFGEPLAVERTVRLFESAHLAGLHLEDQQSPKRCGHLSGKTLISAEEMQAKLRAAVAARQDPDFVIVARTDARAVEGFDAAVDRANAYVDAGADLIFPEALESPDEFARFAEAVSVPLMANMTEFGQSPLLSADELGAMGYAAVLFPVTILRVAMKAVEAALQELHRDGTQQALLDRMQTRAELYDLLGYEDYEARDREYFQ